MPSELSTSWLIGGPHCPLPHDFSLAAGECRSIIDSVVSLVVERDVFKVALQKRFARLTEIVNPMLFAKSECPDVDTPHQ